MTTLIKHPRMIGKSASMIEPAVIHQLINEDTKFQKQVEGAQKCFSSIERYNPLHYRLKIEAVKNQLIDEFIMKFIIKRDIIINIISKLVKDYWKKNPVLINDYQEWLYFNYTGVDRFSYSQIARDFYVDRGVPPYTYTVRQEVECV